MAHFLLAWELGANLGHGTRLRSVALALKQRGHQVTFALRDVVSVRDLLSPELGRVFQAPLRLNMGSKPAFTMADVLLSCGYDSVPTLGALTQAWTALLDACGCDVVLADHSPTALLAARLADVPALHIGSGFAIPPRETPLPVFRDWASVEASHADQADAHALACINDVLSVSGAMPLKHLWQLFYPQKTLLCAWPELDHYAGRGRSTAEYRGPDSEFVPGVSPQWPDAKGPRVFAYLRANHPEHGAVLRGLIKQGCATLCFFPDREASSSTPEASEQLRYCAMPVDMKQALAECELVVCHAGHATLAQTMRSGVPSLMLPTQTEQFLLARQVERFGVGINAAALPRPVDYAALIGQLMRPDSSHRAAAHEMAQRYRRFDPAALTTEIVLAAESLLASVT